MNFTLFGPFSIFILIPLLFTATEITHAQYRQKIVFWDDQPSCGEKNFAANQLECGTTVDPNGPVQTLTAKQLKMFLQFTETKERFLVRLRLENVGDGILDLERGTWSVAHYLDATSFRTRQSPIMNERISFRPPPKGGGGHVAGPTMGSRSNTSEVPGLRRTETVAHVGGGTSGATQIPAGQQSIAIIPPTSTVSSTTVPVLRKKGLPKKSPYFQASEFIFDAIKPSSSLSGILYFRQAKKTSFKLLFIHIGDTTYVFQFDSPKPDK